MADNIDAQNKEENFEEEGVISLDDLDSLLAEEDPEFADEMQKMSNDEELRNAEVEVIEFEQVEEVIEEPQLTYAEKHPKLNKIIAPVKASYIKQKLKIKDFINQSYRKFFEFLVWLKKDFPGLAIKKLLDLKNKVLEGLELIKKWLARYKALSKNKKRGIYSALFLTISLAGIIYISFKKSWIPNIVEPLYTSFDHMADSVTTFSPDKDLKSLYQSFPQEEYFVQMAKIIVNLKSTNPYANPMAAMEFYLQMDSKDTAIEIKDREKQILDVVQRTVEQFTYKELSSKSGVSKLKSVVRSEINNTLNQGRVIKVYQKTMILKK
ncbi:MAG: flagellar basal body-associated FliL family protein [Bdellovibrionales bacterium]|nr:flagellar basal body-associated FliL family protein [Bdellovibrionales bacterium]